MNAHAILSQDLNEGKDAGDMAWQADVGQAAEEEQNAEEVQGIAWVLQDWKLYRESGRCIIHE